MKLALAIAICVLTVSPAAARHPKQWIEQSVGQDVFSLTGTLVGRLDRYIDLYGTPGAIVTTSDGQRERNIIVAADDLGGRYDGGLLLALTDTSVMGLPRYHPGWALPLW